MGSQAPQLDIDDAFRRREWRLERAGWVLLALVVLGALAGAAGSGPLSRATATSPHGGLVVSFQRIEHREADATLRLGLRAPGTADVTLTVARSWVEAVDVRSIVPEPAEQVATPDGLRLVIPVAGTGEVSITIAYRAQQIGVVRGGVTLAGQAAHFQQLVLP